MDSKQLYEKQSNQYNPFFPIVRLEDIIDKITDKSIQWILNNYNHIYVEYSESREVTRNKVPQMLRRSGLWISYNNGKKNITEYYLGENTNVNNYVEWASDDNWKEFDELTIQDKSITYQHLSDALRELVAGGNTITNFPDEEDITSDGTVLSFKDREYDPNTFSGLGRVILRKNLKVIDGQPKNILTQGMIDKENTIYEIRYDFDLGGKEITIPEGCVLDFQGGSLSNGTIVGNDTILKSEPIIIFNNISVLGTWKLKNAYSEWFNCKNNNSIQKCLDVFSLCTLLNNKNYILYNNIIIDNTTLIGNNATIVYGGGSVIINSDCNINNLNIYITKDISVNGLTIATTKSITRSISIKNVSITFEKVRHNGEIGMILEDKNGKGIHNLRADNIIVRNADIGFKCDAYPFNTTVGWINSCSFNNCYASGVNTVLMLISNKINNISSQIVGNTFDINFQNNSSSNPTYKEVFIVNGGNITNNIISGYLWGLFPEWNKGSILGNVGVNTFINKYNDAIYCESSKTYFIGSIKKSSVGNINFNITIRDHLSNNTKYFITSNSDGHLIITPFSFKHRDSIKFLYKEFNDIIYLYATGIRTGYNSFKVDKAPFITIYPYLRAITEQDYLLSLIEIPLQKTIYDATLVTSPSASPLTRGMMLFSSVDKHPYWYDEVANKWIAYDGTYRPIYRSGHPNVKPTAEENNITKGFMFYDTVNKKALFYDDVWREYDGVLENTARNGITSLRPSEESIYSGFQFFDKTILKLIIWTGSKWINCLGDNPDDKDNGVFENKPISPRRGFAYFCTDRQTAEGGTNGIMIYHKGNNVWVDALGRVVN